MTINIDEAAGAPVSDAGSPADYIEPLEQFLAEADTPTEYIFPELLPCGVIMLVHGHPRARKSLAAFELALAAATGTAPFGLARFKPSSEIRVLYVMEEDPRDLTRKRLRKLVRTRSELPITMLDVSVRRGVDLDDPAWVTRLIGDLQRLGIKLLVLDAARRLSAKTDEGPAKVRELTAVLRRIVTAAGVTVVIVHHDTKPPTNGQDGRSRSQRASGADWFAACECPVHVERIGRRESLVFPEDYKFAGDPAPFSFSHDVEDGLVTRLIGTDTTADEAEHAGLRGRVLDWLRVNGPATRSAMKGARLGQWEAIEAAVEVLSKDGKIDAVPGRKAGSWRYFVPGTEPAAPSQEDSRERKNG